MKKLSLLLALACICGLGLSLNAQNAAEAAQPAPQIKAEEDTSLLPSFSIELDWRTKYISKGEIVNNEHNVAVDLRMDWLGFYAELWSPIDMTNYYHGGRPGSAYTKRRKHRPEEVDYTLGFGHTFGADLLGGFSPLSIDINATYYQYPHYFDNFHEVPVTLTVTLDDILSSFKDSDCKASLALGAQWTYDIHNYWWYGNVFNKLKYQLSETVTLSLKNTLYWADEDYKGCATNTVTAMELRGGIDYAVTSNISVGAYVAGSYFVSRHYRRNTRAFNPGAAQNFNGNGNLWGGLTCAFSF